jgi:hypothetical protein
MNKKQDFQAKLAHFNAVKAEVEAFVAQGGDLKSPEAAPLGVRFIAATNDMWVAGGGEPFLVPIDHAGSEKK